MDCISLHLLYVVSRCRKKDTETEAEGDFDITGSLVAHSLSTHKILNREVSYNHTTQTFDIRRKLLGVDAVEPSLLLTTCIFPNESGRCKKKNSFIHLNAFFLVFNVSSLAWCPTSKSIFCVCSFCSWRKLHALAYSTKQRLFLQLLWIFLMQFPHSFLLTAVRIVVFLYQCIYRENRLAYDCNFRQDLSSTWPRLSCPKADS